MAARLQFEIALGMLLVLATTALLIFAGSREETRMVHLAQIQSAQAIEAGATLFETHCRSCHGLNGEGVGQLGPALNNDHFFTARLQEVGWPGTLKGYIVSVTSAGRVTASRPLYAGSGDVAVMNAWSNRYGGPLRDDQIRNLTAFVLNWQDTALNRVELASVVLPTLPASNQAEAVERGREVFLTGGCANCHAIDGISRAENGPNLNHIGSTAAKRKPAFTAENYLRESFLIPNAYYVTEFEPETTANQCNGILTEPQLDDLVTFLLSLQ